MTRSNVKVKVTCPWKLEILPFSKAISSAIYNGSWQLTTDSKTRAQYHFFTPIYAICSCGLDAGQGNVNILQHFHWDRRDGVNLELFLNLPIQLYLNNVTNLHKLTSQNTLTCPTTQRSWITVMLLQPIYRQAWAGRPITSSSSAPNRHLFWTCSW